MNKREHDSNEVIRKSVPFDLKAIDVEAGTFEGYASTWDEDSYGDVIMPGAFKRTLAAHAAKGRAVPVLWQHWPDQPIGVTLEAREDEVGLWVKGRLILEVEQAREALALMKAGALGGLSIGFSIPRGGQEWDEESDVRRITEVRLWEYSPVTFPANENAVLTSVKSADTKALIETTEALHSELRELVKALRGSPAEPLEGRHAPDPSGVLEALEEARSIARSLRGD